MEVTTAPKCFNTKYFAVSTPGPECSMWKPIFFGTPCRYKNDEIEVLIIINPNLQYFPLSILTVRDRVSLTAYQSTTKLFWI